MVFLMRGILRHVKSVILIVQLVPIQLHVILVHLIYSLFQTVTVRMAITRKIMEHVRCAQSSVQLVLISINAHYAQ